MHEPSQVGPAQYSPLVRYTHGFGIAESFRFLQKKMRIIPPVKETVAII
jgi:hypothetical protein